MHNSLIFNFMHCTFARDISKRPVGHNLPPGRGFRHRLLLLCGVIFRYAGGKHGLPDRHTQPRVE